MNSARNRRPAIRERARYARIRRLSLELEKNGMPEPKIKKTGPATIEGRVYLNYDDTEERHVYTSLWIELPLSNLTETVQSMYKNGFWAPRPHKNELIFIPPYKISQIVLSTDIRTTELVNPDYSVGG